MRPTHVRALAVPVVAVLAAALFATNLTGERSEPATAGPGGASVESLVAEPGRWAGREVTVGGAVEERYADRAFSLGRENTVDDVIVLPTGDLAEGGWTWPTGVTEVTGVVRTIGDDDAEILGGDLTVRRGTALIEATRIE